MHTGVHSPSLTGSSQLDLYRPLLPPTLLVGSHELGGISTTISAYESLLLRGYDVDTVLVFREEYYRNFEYLQAWFGDRGINVAVIDQPPAISPQQEEDRKQLEFYYHKISNEKGVAPLQSVVKTLQQIHEARLNDLRSGPKRARESFWYPFCQHSHLKDDSDIMVIDSAQGDFFSVFRDPSSLSSSQTPSPSTPHKHDHNRKPTLPIAPLSSSLTRPMFDGSASWWTQCLGHAHPELTLAAAHASGRYGHVMFPSATSVPSLTLAERLLSSVGKSWASRVFFSDDGSTGMEVALKMALRAYAERHGLQKDSSGTLAVLGLKGSYHGDTIGAMDACEGNVYNERVEWYRGRGLWLDSPTIKIEKGKVVIRTDGGKILASYADLTQIYDVEKRLLSDELTDVYRREIEETIRKRFEEGGIRFGALILEPVVMGAGGMIFVDPLFQRILVDTVRNNRDLFPEPSSPLSYQETAPSSSQPWRGLPVIFDEVFVGLRRLGRPSASTFLGTDIKPDIAAYAKILTGGLLPLAVTLASDSIFQAFWRPQKVDALLHGHSYTAHPIGCSVANKTLDILDGMDARGVWNRPRGDWKAMDTELVTAPSGPARRAVSSTSEPVWSFWSPSFVHAVSHLENVEGVIAMGTVLAISLRAGDSAGYQSTASESILQRIKEVSLLAPSPSVSLGGRPFSIHARPLGNVIYLMSSLNSKKETLRAVEDVLFDGLKRQED